jgi:hypothetical protein
VEVDGSETEEEQRAALNKLSQVKKYFLNQMKLQDLDVIGQYMLGPDLKATRLKKQEEWLKQIAQIHKAVGYFQLEAEKRVTMPTSIGSQWWEYSDNSMFLGNRICQHIACRLNIIKAKP